MEQQHSNYIFQDQVMLRVPFYSVGCYRPGALETILGTAEFRNALWLASPAFYGELEKLDFDYARLDQRKRHSLLKYFNRMCFRPTPFGAFASFSLVSWSEENNIRLSAKSRLHLQVSRELQVQLAAQVPVTSALLCLHPLLYAFGDNYRYIFAGQSDTKPFFGLNSLPGAGLNRLLVAEMAARPLTFLAVCRFISDETGCNPAEAQDYVNFLLREQVLLRNELPSLIEPGDGAAFGGNTMDFDSGLDLKKWTQDQEVIAGNSGKVHTPFYTALEREAETGGVDQADRQALAGALQALETLAIAPVNPALRDFMLAFKARFDRERVPLLTALDPDAGISYGGSLKQGAESLLLEELAFPAEVRETPPLKWTAVQQLFLRVWLHNGRRHGYEPVVLTEGDLAGMPLRVNPAKKPPSIAVLYRKCGGQLWIESAGGVTAASLVGRFSVFSPAIHQLCISVREQEASANPGVLFAELSHHSDPHVDNVNRRRQIYEKVIPLSGFSPPADDSQLLPADLWLSVQGEELVLESASLAKRVIPRLPTAYNYHHTELPVFRFLCDLQGQGLQTDLTFDLLRLLPGLPFYPRVEYARSILALATWNLSPADTGFLLEMPLSLGRLHLFCREKEIPPEISLGTGDQQLVFNLSEDAESLFFLNCLKKGEAVTLREYLPPDDSIRTGPQHHHAGQFLTLGINPKEVYPARLLQRAAGIEKQRIYPLGSDWLFLKIYCTPRSSDQLLAEVIRPLLTGQPAGLQSWFFIRFAKGGYHLRLRLNGDPEQLAGFLPGLQRLLAAGGSGTLVRELQGDSYKRELERYGPARIEMAEDCFRTGSEWALYALTGLEADYPGLGAEKAVLALVWLMAGNFLGDLQAVQQLYDRLAAGFLANFGHDRALKIDLDKKYRALRPDLGHVLSAEFLADFAAKPVTRQLLEALGKLSGDSAGNRDQELLADLVHMQVNRVFAADHLHYEAVIYYCLGKYLSGGIHGKPSGH